MKLNSLGELIRHHRKKIKLTQKELGEAVGKGESTVRMWELNKNTPTADTIEKLAKILNINYFDLMGQAGYLNQVDPSNLFNASTEILNTFVQDFASLHNLKIERDHLIKENATLKSAATINDEIMSNIERNNVRIKEITDLEKLFIEKTSEFEKKHTEYILAASQTLIEEVYSDDLEIVLEKVFNSEFPITLSGKKLTIADKKKAISILKNVFE